MIRIGLTFLAIALLASTSHATTGWGWHSVDIRSQYRIHGNEGSSFVNKLSDDGNLLEPELCSNLLNQTRLYCPPDYAVTDSLLHIRYRSYDKSGTFFYSIDLGSDEVSGPFTFEEFKETQTEYANLTWKTPWTAADKFGVMVLLIQVAVVVGGIALLYAAYRLLSGLIRRRRS